MSKVLGKEIFKDLMDLYEQEESLSELSKEELNEHKKLFEKIKVYEDKVYVELNGVFDSIENALHLYFKHKDIDWNKMFFGFGFSCFEASLFIEYYLKKGNKDYKWKEFKKLY